MRPHALFLALAAGLTAGARAENAPFDLAGPTLRITVTHDGRTLPIANVPQLATGDRIQVRADLPADQSAHYLLIASFLRGSTNPPPEKWFARAETWKAKDRDGLSLTVPEGAQQVMLFLAPATGGDYATLRNAVQGKPGAFVRAAQDLAQASLDHRRLGAYLAAVRKPAPGDPDRLARVTPLLARSLQIKVNADCLAKTPELQAACLLQNQESLVLNDGHSNEITDALAGPGVDLALQFSATPQGGLGYYSPYIAAMRDIVGMFNSLRTAKYQYIPALATMDGDRMALILNAPPSFHNPKSVLVAALPIVAPIRVPPLEIAERDPSFCAQGNDRGSEIVLPVSGAPLIYATHYAHDLALRLDLGAGRTIDLPALPDVERGALIVRTEGKVPADLKTPIRAVIHGLWGFQPFDGPAVTLQPAAAGSWRAAASAGDAKRDGKVELVGGPAACVTAITRGDATLAWKRLAPDRIAVTLGEDRPGATTLTVAGPKGSDPVELTLAGAAPPPAIAVSLIARHAERPPQPGPVPIALGNDDQIAADATLRLSLRAGKGMRFTGRETVEIAAGSGGETAKLTVGKGVLLADPQVAIVTVPLAGALGPSAYGPLRARVVRDDAAGDWLPIGTLVRLPAIHQLRCPDDAAATACTLSGDNLFLIADVSPTADFAKPVPIPDGYPGTAIQVPRPADKILYVHWHDDPTIAGRVGQ